MDKKDEGFTLNEWQAVAPKPFDRTEAYTSTIEPMVDALRAKCAELGIPLVVLTASSQDDKEAQYHVQASLTNPAESPHLLLLSYMAAQGDLGGINDVLRANHMRSILAGITKH